VKYPAVPNGSHKFSPFENFNVLSRESKPRTFRVLRCKASVPIVLDPVCVVCPDGMNQLQILWKLYRYLIRPALDKNCFADLVTFFPPKL
jgi:hypothetical protein